MNELLSKLERGEDALKGYNLQQGIILKKGRILLVAHSPFKDKIPYCVLQDPQVGHSGFLKTYHYAKNEFYCVGMKKDIKRVTRE